MLFLYYKPSTTTFEASNIGFTSFAVGGALVGVASVCHCPSLLSVMGVCGQLSLTRVKLRSSGTDTAYIGYLSCCSSPCLFRFYGSSRCPTFCSGMVILDEGVVLIHLVGFLTDGFKVTSPHQREALH